jgi:hypothetical protein
MQKLGLEEKMDDHSGSERAVGGKKEEKRKQSNENMMT